MPRRTILKIGLVLLFPIGAAELWAQDLGNLQLHGFATQGFLYSSNNNYLTMDSSRGSLQWTEGAISFTDPISDNLRIGAQMHMYQLGQFGGPVVRLDWASGDYKLNDQAGFRAGKVKIPFGLYNDSQDVDALFLWVLLPQCHYPDDNRDFDLALLGGEFYGSIGLGKRSGRLQYRGYMGENSLDAKGGYMEQLAEAGLTLPNPPSGQIYGGDIRWLTPLRGLTIGSSAQSQALDGSGPQGTFHMGADMVPDQYAEFTRGKLHIAAEYMRAPFKPVLTIGSLVIPAPFDQRSWYPMVDYRGAPKLHLGTYYSHSVNKVGDTSQPANFSKDWVISGRYDFNNYFYGKLETHFLHGNELGYYLIDNPNGLKPDSKMLAARVGFAF
jgi:hypothetical protein